MGELGIILNFLMRLLSSSSSRTRLSIAIIAITVVLGFIVSIIPVSPGGRFRDPSIGSEGVAFYEIADGAVFLKINEDGEEVHKENMGSYRKSGDRWLWKSSNGDLFELRATIFSLSFFETNGSLCGGKFPRMFPFSKIKK